MLKCVYIAIVDEAAQVLESHLVAALTSSCEHLIMIGIKMAKFRKIFLQLTKIFPRRSSTTKTIDQC